MMPGGSGVGKPGMSPCHRHQAMAGGGESWNMQQQMETFISQKNGEKWGRNAGLSCRLLDKEQQRGKEKEWSSQIPSGATKALTGLG